MKFASPSPLAVWTLAACGAVAAAGCGGSDPNGAPSANGDPSPNGAPAANGDPAGNAPAGRAAADAGGIAPFTDPAGRKWLNKTIPYDAYATAPDRSPGAAAAVATTNAGPRNLLAGIGSGMSAPRSPGGPAMGAPVDVGRGATPSPAMAGGMGSGAVGEEPTGEDSGGWGTVISAEDLRDEIKRSRNEIAAAVGTVAAFNRMQADLPAEAAALAAMAQITAEHPGAVPWKENADAVRTLAVRVGEAAGSRGRTARDEARESFDPLDSILGGNPPPDGAVAEFDRQIDAPRGDLMKRMGTALKYLQQEAPDADTMTANADDLARQAAVLAALGRFTAHEAYDNAAEPDYQQWASGLTAAAIEAGRKTGAVYDVPNNLREVPDYAAFRAAVDRAAATCADCHGAYR
ncbi:cytochrome c [Alienimonas californiensis]|uniref:Cytochrome C n=1 Tax=Alienimonas californiensis TaxID=2527989 RepID=A0A517P636_9PLAN|nr:cytochrome c [Alienimonas californiensis]QDT14833.1 hypothetical protein CA12_09130 [Alienimonas californiensis]